MEHYDYIIAGTGCAGLSLAVHLIHSGAFRNQKILLVDRAPKERNDHTWCFWEKGSGLFEPVVSGRWTALDVHFTGFSRRLEIAPYQYKMIRADDFYRYSLGLIRQQPNMTFQYGNIESLETRGEAAVLRLSGKEVSARYVFNSVNPEPLQKQPGRHYLLQHFKGWMIETDEPAFRPEAATLMDFRVPQDAGASFTYVLPLSATKAMVEATVFSGAVLEDAAYTQMLKRYLEQYFPGKSYRIVEEEYGVIPMSSHRYPAARGRVIFLGTAGGQTRASTGYTFMPIQRHSARLALQLAASGHPFLQEPWLQKRTLFYDGVLLRLLAGRVLPGAAIFARLFRRNPPQRILRFLDGESNLADELGLTWTLQKGPFIRAALAEVTRAMG